jgi:hypothetical protein
VLFLVASLLVQFDELRLSRETLAYEVSDILDAGEVEALAHVEPEQPENPPAPPRDPCP